ncbi:hypothetical protein Nepgr_023154 [Nepenthes gracilis]|uniref:Uncharacterized protein n=1 Tax=Nepenthes gracilis TaxID=150966 RepID=A0AAD3XXG3_NEPGR|nr:hypothetical protein Nepgr_023154 [Nepenthes gracilis]
MEGLNATVNSLYVGNLLGKWVLLLVAKLTSRKLPSVLLLLEYFVGWSAEFAADGMINAVGMLMKKPEAEPCPHLSQQRSTSLDCSNGRNNISFWLQLLSAVALSEQQGEQSDPPSCRQRIHHQQQGNAWTVVTARNNHHRGQAAGQHHQQHHHLSSYSQLQLPASVTSAVLDQQCCVLSPSGVAHGYGKTIVSRDQLLEVVGVVGGAAMHLLAGIVALLLSKGMAERCCVVSIEVESDMQFGLLVDGSGGLCCSLCSNCCYQPVPFLDDLNFVADDTEPTVAVEDAAGSMDPSQLVSSCL